MFCVVQEIQLKKQPKDGDYREYEVQCSTFLNSDGSVKETYYAYYANYDAGCFQRPIKTAYKVSVHQSYRDNGKVKKRQYAIATIGYYHLIHWGLYDCIDSGVQKAAEALGIPYDEVFDLVEKKMAPIRDRVEKEYHRTEEYKTTTERKKILERYRKAKAAFAKKYRVDEHQYDVCYNVFGEVMNQERLDQIIRDAEAYSSYRKNSYSTYGRNSNFWDDFRSGGYGVQTSSTYTAEETAILKQFYRSLSKAYHPDMNPDRDTTAEMQLLNKLKEAWKV